MVDPTWGKECPACGYSAQVNQMGQMYGHEGATGCPHQGSRFTPRRSGIYPLKFDTRPAITATLAHKEDWEAATIRYDWEHADLIVTGEHLSLRDGYGDPFGIGEVKGLARGPAREVLKKTWDSSARYPLGSGDELLAAMDRYYGEGTVTLDTEVLGIIYEPNVVGFR